MPQDKKNEFYAAHGTYKKALKRVCPNHGLPVQVKRGNYLKKTDIGIFVIAVDGLKGLLFVNRQVVEDR